MQMNRVVIAGYVSKTAQVQRLPSGTAVANVRVGESVRYADGSGETRELTNWYSLSFYGKRADVAQALKKGRQHIRRWPDRVAAVHCARRQQATDDARDRSEPVSRDRAHPTRDQSRGISGGKKRRQWISEYGRRG